MLKFNLNYFYIFTFIMLFCFQCFVVPFGGKYIIIGSLLMIFSFIFAIIKNYKHFLFRIKEFLNNKNSILFSLFILWIILSGLILIVLGKTSLKITGGHILTGIVYSVIFPLFYGFFITKEIGAKNIIKILLIALYGMLLFGLFDFIIFYFDILPLKKIYWFFVNSQTLRDNIEARTITLLGIPRIRSTFYEPGVYSYFLALILPFIYFYCFSKYTLFKHKQEILIKKTLPALTWFNIIFTLSPIGIIMSIISSFIYYIKIHKLKLKNVIAFLISGLVVLMGLFVFSKTTSVGEKVFSRIFSIVYLFSDFSTFAMIESSLATRIVYYVNCTIVGFKNIILGVGWGHLGLDLTKQLQISPLPLTQENYFVYFVKGSDSTSYVLSFAYAIFGSTGLLGFALFYTWIVKIYKKLQKLLRVIKYNIDNLFIKILSIYLILFILYSFYESPVYYPYYWLIFGIIIAYISEIKKYIMIRRGNDACINNCPDL